MHRSKKYDLYGATQMPTCQDAVAVANREVSWSDTEWKNLLYVLYTYKHEVVDQSTDIGLERECHAQRHLENECDCDQPAGRTSVGLC